MGHRLFFASPYSEDVRWVRNAVAAACRELKVEFRSVDEMVVPGGNAVDATHSEITFASLAIAVASGLNANVMYELGLLHCQSKATIILADERTLAGLPFNLRNLTVVRYDSDAKD